MNKAEVPEMSGEVRAAFEPILKVLGPVRLSLAGRRRGRGPTRL